MSCEQTESFTNTTPLISTNERDENAPLISTNERDENGNCPLSKIEETRED
jgi:hypothetical protein